MSSKKMVKYKCPYCEKRLTREDLVVHVEETHEDMMPEDFTAFRLVFNYVNKKPMSYHGKCTECGGPTNWDENKGRYDRQCQKTACKTSYIKKFESNMQRTQGVTRITSTAAGQEKMLANRKISGTYKFQNGTVKTYTGSYELKALKFMDQVMNINPDDIMCPGPILEYTYNEKKHLYITDFYYAPYNLIIEVKDGGNRPNKRDMPDYRGKQIAKEQYIIKNTNYNYLRLTDNDLSQLLSVFMDLKMQMIEETGERVIHVNEACKDLASARNFVSDVGELAKKYNANYFIVTDGASGTSNGNGVSNPAVKNARNEQIKWEKKHGFDPDEDWSKKKKKSLNEAMCALMTGYVPGIESPGSVYVVNYMQNNVFSGEQDRGYGISDNPKLTNLICRNKVGVLSKAPEDFLENCTYDVYLVQKTPKEVSEALSPYMDKFVAEDFVYETLFGKKMYTYDQIMTEELAIPVTDFYRGMEMLKESVHNFLIGKKKSELDYFLYATESGMDCTDIGKDESKTCISYVSLEDGKYNIESTQFPGLSLESTFLNDSVEKRFLEGLAFRKEIR